MCRDQPENFFQNSEKKDKETKKNDERKSASVEDTRWS